MSRMETVVTPIVSVANTYGRITRQSWEDIGLKLCRRSRFLYEVVDHGAAADVDRVMLYFVVHWPATHAKPAALRAYERDNPAKVEMALDKAEKARSKSRKCLTCRTTFESEGPHHRMCARCRQTGGTLPPQMVG